MQAFHTVDPRLAAGGLFLMEIFYFLRLSIKSIDFKAYLGIYKHENTTYLLPRIEL